MGAIWHRSRIVYTILMYMYVKAGSKYLDNIVLLHATELPYLQLLFNILYIDPRWMPSLSEVVFWMSLIHEIIKRTYNKQSRQTGYITKYTGTPSNDTTRTIQYTTLSLKHVYHRLTRHLYKHDWDHWKTNFKLNETDLHQRSIEGKLVIEMNNTNQTADWLSSIENKLHVDWDQCKSNFRLIEINRKQTSSWMRPMYIKLQGDWDQ